MGLILFYHFKKDYMLNKVKYIPDQNFKVMSQDRSFQGFFFYINNNSAMF